MKNLISEIVFESKRMDNEKMIPPSLREAFDYMLDEYRRYVQDRSVWECEKRELQDTIGSLQGQIQVFERNQTVLCKRLDMFEYSVRQEREKYAKLCERVKNWDKEQVLRYMETSQSTPMVTSEKIKTFEDSSSAIKSKTMPLQMRSFPFSEGKITSPGRDKLKALLEQMGYRLPQKQQQQQQKSLEESRVDPVKQVEEKDTLASAVKEENETPEEEEETFNVSNITLPKGMASKLGRSRKGGPTTSQKSKRPISASKSNSSTGTMNLSKTKNSSSSESAGVGQWKPKVSLVSHLDSVRDLEFLPQSKRMLSASEDCTLKLWDISSRTCTHTFYGHTGPVTAIATNESENTLISTSTDTFIRIWNIPSPHNSSSSSPHNDSFSTCSVNIHSDCVWDIQPIIGSDDSRVYLSASADATIGVWKYAGDKVSVLESLEYERDDDEEEVPIIPTSIATLDTNAHQFLSTFRNGDLVLFDVEKGVPVKTFKSIKETWATKVVTNDSLAFVGNDDNSIKMYDLNSGTLLHTLMAHASAISSLCISHDKSMLISSSHDGSLRWWDLSTRTCIQDMSSHETHRPKYDESIHTIISHPSKPIIASGGTDCVIKLYST